MAHATRLTAWKNGPVARWDSILQRSPDSVRRYLPLSVIWVTTMRLKKLIALLNNAGRGLTATEEQIEETLDDLRCQDEQSWPDLSLEVASVGGAPAMASAPPSPNSPGLPLAPIPGVRAFDASLPEIPVLTAGTRAELERDVREQLRRELEDEVRAEIATEVTTRRGRSPAPGAADSGAPPVAGGADSESCGERQAVCRPFSHPSQWERTASSRPVQITSEQSAEAIEVFREEAQEHLQSITSGIAELENARHLTPRCCKIFAARCTPSKALPG